MATGINLLPQDTKPKVSIIKLSGKLRRFIIAGFVVLIFLTSTVIGVVFILSNNLKASLARQEDLKNQIKSLESTEQKLVLIRDRLTKAKEIQNFASTKEELDTLSNTLDETSQQDGVGFNSAELANTYADITLGVNSANTLSKLLYLIYSKDEYKKIDLLSLQYSTKDGYKVQLQIIK